MNEEKQCFKCSTVKPLDHFYEHPEMADGHLNKCKDCTKKDSINRRNQKIEEVRAYDRSRGSLPHRVESRKQYAETPQGKAKLREGSKRWEDKNPLKTAAHTAVNNAVRDGRLVKFPCSVCGDPYSEGHHEDYSKPLEVLWFCPAHHALHHKAKRETERLAA